MLNQKFHIIEISISFIEKKYFPVFKDKLTFQVA